MLDIKNIRRNELCAYHQGAHHPVGMVNGMGRQMHGCGQKGSGFTFELHTHKAVQ